MPKGYRKNGEPVARTHGMCKAPEYFIWKDIKKRCSTPNIDSSQYYYDRGITVCEEWVHSFETFYADMGPRPPNTTIERRDSCKDYSKENCYWATPRIQSINQGFRKDNTSGFFGVCETNDVVDRPWTAQIQNNKKRVKIGRFRTAVEAALAYNKIARELHGEYAKQNWLPIPSINYGKA